MIAVKLMGGLGNQMFQYAFGRSYSINNNTKLALDLTFFNDQTDIETPRKYELDCFNIKPQLITDNLSEDKPKFSLFSKKVYLPNRYLEKGFPFSKAVFNQPDNTLFQGYWQSEKYFISIREQLLKDFTLKSTLNTKDHMILNKIKSSPSLSLHVRRGDYVSSKLTNKFHGTKGLDYYKKAIELVTKKVGDVKVFVFSDDIDWCKKNLSLLYKDIYFVDGERKGYIDMYLMQNCDNNIIANSSFSWWAAWLNNNPSKIVVAPKIWFNDKTVNTKDVIPSTWHKI